MSPKSREERVNDALAQIVDRNLPALPTNNDGEDGEGDERFFRALEAAKATIENDAVPSVLPDANHVADLIKHQLVRDSSTPDNALLFSNLFSRLLSQPVLSQKWAILYLLYQLSNTSETTSLSPASATPLAHSSRSQTIPYQSSSRTQRSPLPAPTSTSTPSARNNHLSNALLDDALATSGIPDHRSPREREQEQEQPLGKLPNNYPSRRDPPLLNGDASKNNDIPQDKDNPSLNHSFRPSEAAILRDLPFTLQAISSSNLTLASPTSLKFPTTLPGPIVSLLHSLAEPALLYKGLSRFQESTDGGLIGQSLRAAINIELRAYLSLVASLEGHIRRALSHLHESQSRKGLAKAGVTLRRMVIWTRDATMALRLMTLITDEFKTRKGGQLISLIHSFSASHGDPFVNGFAERLLVHVTKPFYDMLRSWIYDGELSDPYLEFFVTENPQIGDDGGRGGATSVWEYKYKLNDNMVPTIITAEFAKKVFLIGKSLNFIRYGCEDSAWVEAYSRDASRELRYGDTENLEASIDEAYKTTMARLIHLMNDKFKLNQHLSALKQYLLLGKGDFIALLMESLSSNLDRPANSQYRHTLTAQLEHAIRNSNAQFDPPDVLRRLDARMLELSHGEVGWDVFTLEYKIDAPVDVVVTPYGSKQYLKVFNFLWRVKRVEYALGSTWRRCMTGARGVLGSVADKVGQDWKTARCAIAEMIHFVCQLQYYILFEVIEASWDQLQKAMSKPDCTLDDLVEAHAQYLRSITRKGLLGSSNLDFTSQLHELLKTMLAYKDAVDGLYSYSVAESTRRQEKVARIETRTAQGKWGITERDEDDTEYFDKPKSHPRSRDIDSPMPPPLIAIGGAGKSGVDDANVLTALRSRLSELAVDFRARVSGLLGDLAHQPDMDMRFLGVVMNFNDTYKVVRRSRRKAGGTGTAAAGSATGGKTNADETARKARDALKEPPMNE